MLGAFQAAFLANKQRLWTPADVSTLLWLDAADTGTITVTNGKVAQWADKSTGGRHMVQETAEVRPTTGATALNGKNVVSFNGSQYLKTGGSFVALNNIFAIQVCKFSETLNGQYALFLGGGNGRFYMPTQGSGALNWMCSTTGVVFTKPRTAAPFIGAGNHAGNQFVGLYNGTVLGTAPRAQTDTVTECAVGGTSTEGRLAGYMAEVIVRTAVDESTHQQFEGYLAHKWGLSADLPSDHPYRYSAPQVQL